MPPKRPQIFFIKPLLGEETPQRAVGPRLRKESHRPTPTRPVREGSRRTRQRAQENAQRPPSPNWLVSDEVQSDRARPAGVWESSVFDSNPSKARFAKTRGPPFSSLLRSSKTFTPRAPMLGLLASIRNSRHQRRGLLGRQP